MHMLELVWQVPRSCSKSVSERAEGESRDQPRSSTASELVATAAALGLILLIGLIAALLVQSVGLADILLKVKLISHDVSLPH